MERQPLTPQRIVPLSTTGPAIPQPAAPTAAMPGIPGYEVLAFVGRGGMGRVYRARHLRLDRIVALKLLAVGADQDLFERFEQEARAAASLNHPAIAQVFETGAADGQPYFAMEFVEGGSLAEMLQSRPMAPAEAAELLAAVARGVDHAHQAGIIHRDIKPGNILLQAAGNGQRLPKIADFGLARRMESADRLTRTGDILGTPAYMAPEQASGVVSAIGPAADVYSLGAVLYECLTGRPPFTGPDSLQTLMLVLTREPVPPRVLQPTVPNDLNTICLKCLEKSPHRRYATARELAEDLDLFRAGRPIIARPIRSWERAWKWARRNPWPALAATLALGLLLGSLLAVFFLQRAYRETRQANEALEAKNREAEQVLALALHDLDQFTFDTSDRLYELPQGETLRRDLLDRARESLAALDRIRPADPTVRRYQLTAYDRLANAEIKLGRLEPALAAQERAYALAAALADDFPDERDHRRRRLTMALRLTILNNRLERSEAAGRYLDETSRGTEELLATDPNDLAALDLRSAVLKHRALAARDADELEALLLEMVSLARRQAEADPGDLDRPLVLAHEQMLAASIIGKSGKTAPALELLSDADRALAGWTGTDTVRVRQLRAWSHWTRGDILAGARQEKEADAAYRSALAGYATLAADFPRNREYRFNRAQILWQIGQMWALAGEQPKARMDLEQAREILEQLARDGQDDVSSRNILEAVRELLQGK